MALKDSWIDKVNGEDVVDAIDINDIAHAVIELEDELEETTSIPDRSITPEKTTFITEEETGEGAVTEIIPNFTNKVDPSTANDTSPNTAINADEWLNGYRIQSKAISTRAKCVVTGLIPVSNGDVVRIKGFDDSETTISGTKANNDFKVVAIKSDGTVSVTEVQIAKTSSGNTQGKLEQMDPDELAKGIYCFTVGKPVLNTDLVAYIRVCGFPTDGNEGIVVTVNEPITYTEVTTGGETEYILDPNIVVPLAEENKERIDTHDVMLSNAGADFPSILLLDEAVAMAGVEFNIYKKNIIFSSRSLDNWDIRATLTGSNGAALMNYAECLRITPTDSQVGDYTLKVQMLDIRTNAVVCEKQMTLHIIANNIATTKNVLYIGDSLTFSRGGLYAAEIQYNLSGGKVVSIGTQTGSASANGIGAVQHEGYNGAAALGFLAEYIKTGVSNPFWNPSTASFDLGYYMTENGFSQLDAVMLNLGANMLGANVSAINGLNGIIEGIRSYDEDIPVIISLAPPVSGQDAWKDSSYTAHQMRMYWHSLMDVYMDNYGGGKLHNVYLSTPYFNVDPDYDFPTETVDRCARDATQVVRQVDKMHPTAIGTLKMADAYYPWILYAIGNS